MLNANDLPSTYFKLIGLFLTGVSFCFLVKG